MYKEKVLRYLLVLASFWGYAAPVAAQAYQYQPADKELYATVVGLDSAFFAAYNTCNVNLDTYSTFYSDSLEFYHDNGGLTKDKKEVVEATRRNICGKVTRNLVKGSIEVYRIPGFGAIEMGLHSFFNKEEPNATPKVGRFMIFWQYQNNKWKITKVVSLH